MYTSLTLLQTLTARKQYLEQLLQEAEYRLENAPSGMLRICRGQTGIQYYKRSRPSDRKGVYLSHKNMNEIRLLAQKGYDIKLIRSLKQELHAIKQYLLKVPDTPPESVYHACNPLRQALVIPGIETEEEFIKRWESFEYNGKSFPEDYPEFYTDKGERVRSKSEIIIADMLAREGIPYRYECPIVLKGIGKAYPDFSVLNIRLRKEYIWEHFGLMDDPVYAANAVKKQQSYCRNGFFPGDNLIITTETRDHPLTKQDLRLIIDHYLR